MTCLRFNEIGL